MVSDESNQNDHGVDGKKRKNDDVVEKRKKKKKKHVIETIEKKEQSDEDVEIKSIKKQKNSDTNAETGRKAKTVKVRELPTVTIAVPGSILDNAQSPEFRTYLAGQIARAACIYKIDEVCCIELIFTLHEAFYF